MKHLKPCPFCNNEDLHIYVYNIKGGTVAQVYCKKCGASGPDIASNTQEAIDIWNKRMTNKII